MRDGKVKGRGNRVGYFANGHHGKKHGPKQGGWDREKKQKGILLNLGTTEPPGRLETTALDIGTPERGTEISIRGVRPAQKNGGKGKI